MRDPDLGPDYDQVSQALGKHGWGLDKYVWQDPWAGIYEVEWVLTSPTGEHPLGNERPKAMSVAQWVAALLDDDRPPDFALQFAGICCKKVPSAGDMFGGFIPPPD